MYAGTCGRFPRYYTLPNAELQHALITLYRRVIGKLAKLACPTMYRPHERMLDLLCKHIPVSTNIPIGRNPTGKRKGEAASLAR
jgi:hypothetical protein